MENIKNSLELFDNINESFEKELYSVSKIIEYTKGSNPFYPENLLKYFYMVIDGKIKTYQINFENNKEQTIFIYKRGDMFDIVSLLDNEPHEVIFEVLEDCKVLQIPIQKVRYWIDTNPTFNRRFFPYLATTLRYTEQLATEISLYDTKDRLINLLLENVNPQNHFKYQLLQNLSNSEIAKLIGTVRHVVERTIRQLKNDKIIEKSKKIIKILDFEKLLEKTSQILLK
jgi:CRP-like cAMP-binding protein